MTIRKIRSDSESDDDVAGPSTKHIKLTNGDTAMNEEEEEEEIDEMEDEGSESTPPVRNLELKPLAVDTDGFVEGSIVKITLTNFVTYDYCEIIPGPHMNMIIGPNGTGKSTIVCAIALGLGGSPALLGRAKDTNEFVKTGEDEATIIIELKKVETRNVIIQRSFKKIGKGSNWRINGKTCTYKEVQTIVNGFNIQVDNLCQFLPQDRVAEFAELTPPLLLQRTQAAAGKAELHEMQQELVKIRDNEKTLIKTHESDLNHLKTLKSKNQELERDVLRMQQRERIVNNIKLLEAQRPLVQYTDSMTKYHRADEDYKSEKEKYQLAREEVAPIKALVDQVKAEQKRANKGMIETANTYKASVRKVREVSEQIKRKRAELNGYKHSIADRKKKIPEREAEVDRTERRIQQLEEQLSVKPNSDTSQFEAAIATINQDINELHMKKSEINQKSDDESRKKLVVANQLKSKDQQMKQLDDIKERRLRKLDQFYPDVVKTYRWLQNNRDKFVGQVYDPVVLLLNLKDPRYASQVEQALGGAKSSHLRQFICERKEDYQLLTKICIDKQKLKITVNWPDLNPAIDYRKAPAPREDLKSRLGLDYYISDLLDGPKYVIDTLCLDTYINLIPATINRINEQQVVDAGLFQKFAAGETYYVVKTSNYGKRSKQTQTSIIPRAQYLSDTIDTEAQSNLKEEMKSLSASIQQADVILKGLSREHDQIKAKLDEKKHAKEDQQAQKRDIQKKVQTYEQHLRRLEQLKVELVEMRKRPEEEKAEITRMEEQIEQMADQEDALITNHAKYMEKVVEFFQERNKAAMLSYFMDTKNKAIETYAATQTENLNNAQKAMLSAKDQLLLAQRETKQYMEASKTAGNDLPEELREEFNDIVRKWKEEGLQISIIELENRIAEEEGKVAGIRYANADAMSHYQERKQTIETLEEKANKNRETLTQYRNQIQVIKGQWAPLIKELVTRIDEKFSAAFKRINCAGAVQLEESEDFDKWGINILVKFRDTEKLQLLTGQRQSGGERSVSTILYLMSLQDLAASPFRVVDEINQGMDPRNERMIHEQIVQSATRPGTSQYFLITPKLLPDLYYNERMRVLCIYNSEALPTKIKPLQAYLDHAKAIGLV